METVKLRIPVPEHSTEFLLQAAPKPTGPGRTTGPAAALHRLGEQCPERSQRELRASETVLLQRLTKGGFEIGTAEYELSAFSSLAGYNWFGFKCFSELMS